MLEIESIKIFNDQSIEKIFDKYKINIISNMDSINIQIQIKDSFNIYESNFNLEYLHRYNLLSGNSNLQELIDFISNLIDLKNIKIEENNMNMKLILISNLSNFSNVELILNKKDLLSNEIIENIINEINYLKNENRDLRKDNMELKERIKLIEEEKLNKINEIEEKIKKLEKFHKEKTEIKLSNCNLINIKSIQPHNSSINSLSIFPSGNIISVSSDKSINIYDINLNIIQNIKNAHDDWINYVQIKDENNFITCSDDENIKLWIKNNNEFTINKIIKNAHEDRINKVIYCSNGNIISCSHDNTIKIWDNDNFKNIKTLFHSDYIYSLLFLEDKNFLISSGNDGTKLWNINNYNNINCITYFQDTFCESNEGLCILDEDRFIVRDKKTTFLKVISILKKEIIIEINHPFYCLGIRLIKEKGIFLVGGNSNDIMIYRNDNYECIQLIKYAHDGNINSFIELKDKSIASFSVDNKIKIWCFN